MEYAVSRDPAKSRDVDGGHGAHRGLVAAISSSPFLADFVTSTTHKTLRGRAAA